MGNKKVIPPKLAGRFLLWFLRKDLAEEVQGDLREQFYTDLKRISGFQARLIYWFQVINYLRPFAIRNLNASYSNFYQYHMFQSHFKIGWRNLTKQKMYSAIKIGGLALGITACLLIALFVRNELSYERQFPDRDRIYRLIGVYGMKGVIPKNTYFPAPMASTLKKDFPEVEAAGRFVASELLGGGGKLVRRADKAENFYEEGIIYFDQELLNILKPRFEYGDLAQALSEPYTIAISKCIADKYFPGEDPLGKILIVNNNEKQSYRITGVFEDFPSTSHLQQYKLLMTLTGQEFWPGEQTFWSSSNYHTYIKVQPGTDVKQLSSKLTEGIVKTYWLSSWRKSGIVDADELANNVTLELQPISDIHLRSAGIWDGLSHGDIRFIWLFSAIAVFILIIACINFINLSTARAANRAREIGLRKVVGSSRGNMIWQFLSESVIFSLLSFILSLFLAYLLLPYFNGLSAKSLIFPWNEWWLLPLIIAVAVIVGLLSGLYPALYLSGFKPIKVLKGGFSQGSKSIKTRSILVIFQYTISAVMIIGTIIIYRQMNFILSKDLGFDKKQVLLIQGANLMGNRITAFKNELLKLSDVDYVSISDYLPVAGTQRNGDAFWKAGRKEVDNPLGGQRWRVDHDYIRTMGMTIIAGRDFDINIASDSQAVVINQSMAKALRFNDPVGHQITNNRQSWHVIGIVKDFNFESLTETIQPLCLEVGKGSSGVLVKINTTEISKTIEQVKSIWDQFTPKSDFRFTFLDERFAMTYANVQRMGRIFTGFAILTIIIACLGLFALSAYMVEQRRKEISLRLVMGAPLNNIFSLLTSNYLFLILISLTIAIPVSWYGMHKWLEDYVYRIKISWDVFVAAGLITVLIAILTISYLSIRAALSNPVDNLRSE